MTTTPLTDTPLVLASTSPYRQMLLARLTTRFSVLAPAVDERVRTGETPRAIATRLAADKALAVAGRAPGSLVIGSDQVAEIDGRPVGKPGDIATARAQLATASGREVVFHTAVCLADARTEATILHPAIDTTHAVFRTLSSGMIDRYLAREPALDCAGAFKAEGLGIALLERIDSEDPTALIGLPLIALARLLGEAGVSVV